MSSKAYMDAWRAANKDKVRKHKATGYRKHRAAILAKVASHYAENRERIRAYRKKWSEQNKEKNRAYKAKHYAENKKKVVVRATLWNKSHPWVIRACLVKRKAKQRQSTPLWANDFFIKEAYHLAALRTKMFGYPWHVDHIVPIQSRVVCGLHVHNNLQVIPASVNQSKSNRFWPDMPTDTPAAQAVEMERLPCPM